MNLFITLGHLTFVDQTIVLIALYSKTYTTLNYKTSQTLVSTI